MKKFVREKLNEADNASDNLKNYDSYKEIISEFPVVKEILEDKHKNSSSIHDFYDFLINDLGIKIRFVPMPGYKFNKETFRFEKK